MNKNEKKTVFQNYTSFKILLENVFKNKLLLRICL